MSTDKVQLAFRTQAQQCAALGSPFMERLLSLFVAHWHSTGAVMERVRLWPGDPGGKADSLPLRLAGGLHALVLSNRHAQLKAAYPPNAPGDAALWRAVKAALDTQADFLLNWIKSPPQTNEVRRSAALIPAAALITDRLKLPLTLSELGASGGLNLNFDRFALRAGPQNLGPADPVLTLAPDWQGTPPPATKIAVTDRRGVDLNPLTAPDDALRLRAYLWADQPHRLHLTDAALACPVPTVDKGDVAPWLANRLRTPAHDTVHLIFHTVAWQYFPAETQAACAGSITDAGAKATSKTPLAWLGMEADDTGQDGAALTLRIWPGDTKLSLGRADFHGRWVKWHPKELST